MTDLQTSIPSFHTVLLVSAAGLPLIASSALLVHGLRRIAVFILVPLSALPALCLALLTFAGADLTADGVSLPWMLTGVRLGIDGTSQVFLLFTSMLWAVAALYARTYMENDPARHRFFFYFLLTMSGNIGLILAQDMVGFYLFFALMTFAAYGLVIHTGSPAAFHAGKIYIIMAVIGEALVIAGMLLAASAAGGSTALRNIPAAVAASENRDLIIALVLSGFGVKAGAVPLHMWLPLAHPVAPTPASAVLSGAMIKAGLLGWLRFLPLGAASLPDWGALCMIAGLSAAFYGVVIGLTQEDPKTVLAYSSVSQMGIMTVALGVGMTASGVWHMASSAVLLYALHHALSKGALFLGVGVAAMTDGGVLRQRLVNAGLLFPALALAGFPLTSGAAAKAALKSASGLVSIPWFGGLEWILSFAAVGTTLLMGRFLFLVLMHTKTETAHGLKPGLWLPWAFLLLCVAAAVWVLPSREFLRAPQTSLSPGDLTGALWPVSAGVVLFWVARISNKKAGVKVVLRIPAGDIVVIAARWLKSIREAWRKHAALYFSGRMTSAAAALRALARSSRTIAVLPEMENALSRWLTAGMLFLALTAALVVLLSS